MATSHYCQIYSISNDIVHFSWQILFAVTILQIYMWTYLRILLLQEYK